MDQQEDFADPPSATPLASERAHAIFVLSGILYPVVCFLLMGCTWGVGCASEQLVFISIVVPSLAIGSAVVIRLCGVRLHWGGVVIFAVWAAMIAIFQYVVIVGIYDSV
jgi:hypothetical protein